MPISFQCKQLKKYNKYKALQVVITITWLHMIISKLWITNWRFNKGICGCYPLKYANLKINLTQVSCRKHITRKISEKHSMFILRRGISFVVFHNILRRGISLSIPNLNSQKYGINYFSFRGTVLLNNLHIKLKNVTLYKNMSYC